MHAVIMTQSAADMTSLAIVNRVSEGRIMDGNMASTFIPILVYLLYIETLHV